MPFFALLSRSFGCLVSALAAALLSVALTGCGGGITNVPSSPSLTIGNTLSAATQGASYSSTVSISGGTAPYNCTFTGLPTWATSVAANCNLIAIPPMAGTFTFNVMVTDSSSPMLSAKGTVTLVVGPPPPLTLGDTMPAATLGTPYSSPVNLTGGTQPYNCTFSGQPAWATSGPNCSLIGVPTTAGPFSFTVSATDSTSPPLSTSGVVKLVVNPAPLVITSGTLPATTVNFPYNQTIGITGGTGAYHCMSTSVLPATLMLNPDCTVSGTPGTAGNFSIALTVTDSGTPVLTTTGTVNLTVAVGAASTGTRVLAGNLPVIGASVQIYAAGKTGNGSAPTALLSTPLLTDASGKFTLDPTQYSCAGTSVIYVVATGGKVGVSGANDSDLSLMSSPGACSNLTSTSNFVLNEVTTVASAYAFRQFLAPGAKLGATATNTSGITLAAGTLANLVDISAGTTPGPAFPATGTAPVGKINLLADLVSNCLTAATNSACTMFYTDATPSGGSTPTNTLDAVLSFAKNPGLDTAAPYAMAAALPSPTYSPIPAAAPSDWMLYLTYAGGGMNDPSAISIDSAGRVWVANYFAIASLFSNTGTPVFANGLVGNGLDNSYGGAVDKADNFWVANEEGGCCGGLGSVSVFNSTGGTAANYTGPNYNFPISISFGNDGFAWVVDYGNSHLAVTDGSGNGVNGSPYGSSQFVFPVAVAVDSNNFGWVANQASNTVTKVSKDGNTFTSYACCAGASGMAIDSTNNVWVANYYGDSIGLVSSAGVIESGANGFGLGNGGIDHPQGIAVDGAGTVWVANYRGPALSELSGASTSTPGTVLSPAKGWAPDANLLEAFGIALDASGNAWVSNFGSNTITEFVGIAAPVKTPLIGPVVTP